jgi:hypothetical protein
MGLIFCFLSKAKQNKKVNPNFTRHKIGKLFWGFTKFYDGGINGFSTNVSFLGERALNEINILHSKVNCKKTSVFAAILGHESRTVSFGISTRFSLSFWKSFNEYLISVRTNLYGVNILLSKQGKTK